MSALRMVRMLLPRVPYKAFGGITTVCTKSIHTSAVRQKSFRRWYQDFWSDPVASPPWAHCTQLGDPVLRTPCTEVPLDCLTDPRIGRVIKQMKSVLRAYNLVGLSANQIGISLKIFIMEFREEQMEQITLDLIRAKEIELFPMTVIINPKLKVTDYNKKIFAEGCASVCGYTAEVPRYEQVQLSGYNENGDAIELTLNGWTARIAQHEMDHMNGIVFTDIMEKKSLACTTWEAVNAYGGRLNIPFYPKK